MDPETDIPRELTKGKKQYIWWHPLYVAPKKKSYKWTYLQNRDRLTDIQNELKVALGGKWGGQGGDGIIREMAQCVHAPLFKINDQQGLTGKHRELCSTSCGSWMGRQFCKKVCTCMEGWEPLLTTWNDHNTVNWLFSNIKKYWKQHPTTRYHIWAHRMGTSHMWADQGPAEGREKGSPFCLHWECQSVNNHCKEQQSGA